jgi:hypothetical protein
METKQPKWKIVGHVGDVDPISYGGGFVFVDETGIYSPELAWFEPATDEEWHEKDGESKLEYSRILLEKDSTIEWWYPRLNELTSFLGVSLVDLQIAAMSANPVTLAQLYSDLIAYFGVEEFDSYPVTLTEKEANEKFAAELRFCRTCK